MADDPEALEREIERTREELALAIDELADRLNPKNAARRGVDRVKTEAGQFTSAVGELVRLGRPAGEDEPAAGPDRKVVVAVGVGVAVTVTALLLWRRSHR
ncbi:DUF3618 domain-containing protein [Actinomadura craniellae]|uniref:DUF3618 domain-containing protein n=1 Tax=Actinomadura craniellae TaxID=2231787 RepID=A0A365H9Q4_9ACTN|nr:DUF3618 domain-containing protein [Actinomadura craniellae]RAY15811.1 DUF3618 domain-containing protein [Actinomadura craniellae]